VTADVAFVTKVFEKLLDELLHERILLNLNNPANPV